MKKSIPVILLIALLLSVLASCHTGSQPVSDTETGITTGTGDPSAAETGTEAETEADIEISGEVLLSFAVLTDTHMGDKNTQESFERLMKYLSTFATAPEAYLHAGDVTNAMGTKKDTTQIDTFKSIYEQYSTPDRFLYSMGPTHDTPEDEDGKEYRVLFEQTMGEAYYTDMLQGGDMTESGLRHKVFGGFHFFAIDWDGASGGWGRFSADVFAEVTVELPAGEHVLRLSKTAGDAGFAEIRSLELELTDAHEVAPIAGSSVVCRVEAESGTILGKCYNSGNTHVAGIDNVGDGVELRISIPADGRYTIRVGHSAPLGEATHTVLLDGRPLGKLRYPGTSTGWGQFSPGNFGELSADLPAGEHVLTILREADDVGFAEIDLVTILTEE